MSIRVGIVGISGFGGGEAMRLVASHPSFELVYAAGEGSAGSRLVNHFPGVPAKLAELVIEKAKAKSIDGATLAYVEMTVTCVRCHQYTREQGIGRLTPSAGIGDGIGQ